MHVLNLFVVLRCTRDGALTAGDDSDLAGPLAMAGPGVMVISALKSTSDEAWSPGLLLKQHKLDYSFTGQLQVCCSDAPM